MSRKRHFRFKRIFIRLEICNRNHLGKTAFVEYVESGRPLPSPKRPLYCEAFVDLQIVFNSTTKARLMELVNLVHWMGGSVSENIDSRPDRLVAFHLRGPKFREAVQRDIQIVNVDYVNHCWDQMRELPHFRASDKEFTLKYKVELCKRKQNTNFYIQRKAFEEQKICYYGYSKEDEETFERYIKKCGGNVTSDFSTATHIMISPNAIADERMRQIVTKYLDGKMAGPPSSPWIVKEDWLWNSIQIDARVGEKAFFPQNLKTQIDLTDKEKSTEEKDCQAGNSRKRRPDSADTTLKSSSSNISIQSESKSLNYNGRSYFI